MTDEDRERRELERRAYGRDATGLTAAETARLAELRGSRPIPVRAAVPGPTSVPDRMPVPEPTSVPEPVEGTHPVLVPDPIPVPDPVEGIRPAPLSRLRTAVRAWLATGRWKRPRYLVGTVLALLLIGIVVGVAIPRPPDIGLVLRAGEAERRDKLMKDDDYDPGSLVLLARMGDVLLWTATQAGGELRCAIMDQPKLSADSQCQGREDHATNPFGLQVSSSSVRFGNGTEESQVGYSGIVFISDTGLVGGSIQRWQADPRMQHQGMSDDEYATSVRLASQQDVESLSIAGHWRGLTIWLGYAGSGSSPCLIVEAPDVRKACGQSTFTVAKPSPEAEAEAEGPSVSLELPATDTRPSARIALRMPMYAPTYLVITENEAVSDSGLFPFG